MRFVEEIVVEEFLPTLRSMLASELRSAGMTQQEVAETLGISQSAVSKYAQGDVSINPDVTTDSRVQEFVDRVASGLASGSMTPAQALVEAEVLIRRLETGGDLLAEMHVESVPALGEYDSDFRIHDPESPLRVNERVLSSLRAGLRIIEHTSGFTTVLPAVGSNLVACRPDAQEIEDVAGVPGRIFDVKGQVRIPSDPEFGASGHVATVLLAARAGGSDATAAINIAYDPAILEAVTSIGHKLEEFDESGDIESSVATAIDRTPDATVLYQTGADGIEPLIYLLGPDPESVARSVRSVIDHR